jgi:hypothetical protein
VHFLLVKLFPDPALELEGAKKGQRLSAEAIIGAFRGVWGILSYLLIAAFERFMHACEG